MNPSSSETPGQNSPQGTGLPPISAPAPASVPTVNDDTSTTGIARLPVLDDTDKVEKKWVDKARQIIKQTHGDPYRQNEELTLLKAEYMKQRYNKIIKVDK